MSTPKSIYHGLSVLSDADASQRLAHPLAATVETYYILSPAQTFSGPRWVFNVFNDALSQLGYDDPDLLDHPAGHPGIDYLCATGQEVKAMYGGVALEPVENSSAKIPRKDVTIRSWTNWDPSSGTRLGFQIQYGHLDSIHPDIGANVPVKKGQALGQSGTTGTWTSHLHVEFQAFDNSGSVTSEDFPAQSLLIDHPSIAAAAQRTRGSMNFACFLPADEAPDIDSNRFSHLPRKLLSVRTSYPFSPPGPPPSSITLDLDVNSLVPVYTTSPGTYDGNVPITHLDRLPHNKIGRYVILREDQIDGYTFYEIEWKDSQRVWVPQKRNLDFLEIPTLMSKEVVAVQIKDASTPP